MGLLDRLRRNAINEGKSISVTALDNTTVTPFFFNHKRGTLDFANAYLWTVMQMIFDGVKNVEFFCTEYNVVADDINRFIDDNAQILLYHYWKYGYATVILTKNGYRLPKVDEIKTDANGKVINKDSYTIYSDKYAITKKSHMAYLYPILAQINQFANNNSYIVNNLGALGIISGDSIPLSPADKEDLQQKLVKDYGLNDNQYKYILSQKELKFTQITLPVKELDLDNKLTDKLKFVCRYFGINPDYMFGETTFSNSTEAKINFYRNVIQVYAEVLLKLARAIFVDRDTTLRPSTIISYRILNVPELQTSLSAAVKEKSEYLAYLTQLQAAGADVTKEIEKLRDTASELLKL